MIFTFIPPPLVLLDDDGVELAGEAGILGDPGKEEDLKFCCSRSAPASPVLCDDPFDDILRLLVSLKINYQLSSAELFFYTIATRFNSL